MRSVVTDGVASVGLSITVVSPEPDEMPFVLRTRMGQGSMQAIR